MQHFKALKETTYGPRFVSPGEVVPMQLEEGQQPDSSIWQAVHSDAHPTTVSTGMESGAPVLAADMPPAMLAQFSQHPLAHYEAQQQEVEELRAKVADIPALEQENVMLERGNASLVSQISTVKKESDALQVQVNSYATKLAEAESTLAEARNTIAALHEERQAMQAEHVELMEKMQEEITALKAENATLKKKK